MAVAFNRETWNINLSLAVALKARYKKVIRFYFDKRIRHKLAWSVLNDISSLWLWSTHGVSIGRLGSPRCSGIKRRFIFVLRMRNKVANVVFECGRLLFVDPADVRVSTGIKLLFAEGKNLAAVSSAAFCYRKKILELPFSFVTSLLAESAPSWIMFVSRNIMQLFALKIAENVCFSACASEAISFHAGVYWSLGRWSNFHFVMCYVIWFDIYALGLEVSDLEHCDKEF